jgi:hypothetical protein
MQTKAIWMMSAFLVWAVAAQAQFKLATNNGAITITGYTGSDPVVTVPGATNGYPVTALGNSSFAFLPIVSVALPDSLKSIGDDAFDGCGDLTNVAAGNGLRNIGAYAFDNCFSLPAITLPATVINIADQAFAECASLAGVYFWGNSPVFGSGVFFDDATTVYYLPGTSGWSSLVGTATTAFWTQPQPLILNGFGFAGNEFRFTISWATNVPVVIEASTNLAAPAWQPLQTNTLVHGTNEFKDLQWASYSRRFYRIRSP